MKSIRRTLLSWLLAGMAIGTVIAAGAIYLQARAEANELFDYQMQQLVASLPHQAFLPIPDGNLPPLDSHQDIVIQIWDLTGLRIYASHRHPSLPQSAHLGFADVRTGEGMWRTFGAQIGFTVVQIAQPQLARDRLAAQTALRTTAPLFLLLPLLGLLIWRVVQAGLSPLQTLTTDVARRDSAALTPLTATDLPSEIAPLQTALNALFARLDLAFSSQRAFIADAAHELRTPLTALRLQAQLIARAENTETRDDAIADLMRGIDRATHLIEQLLTLSRQEEAFSPPEETIEIASLVRELLADRALLAAERGIEVSLRGEAELPGDKEGLRIMLGNLIDNALRHTPSNGQVDVAIAACGDFIRIEVIDTGCGIPASERERVFDRFYRHPCTSGQGSGLGLAIVRRIVERHRGRVRLDDGEQGRGLRAVVELPAALQHPAR